MSSATECETAPSGDRTSGSASTGSTSPGTPGIKSKELENMGHAVQLLMLESNCFHPFDTGIDYSLIYSVGVDRATTKNIPLLTSRPTERTNGHDSSTK